MGDDHNFQRGFLSIFQPTPAASVSMTTSPCEESEETKESAETPEEQVESDDCPSTTAAAATTTWPLSHVRQNFREIRVAPNFLHEDLVPVDVLGGTDTDSEPEEDGQLQDADDGPVGEAESRQDAKAVLKSLEEKIAKCKRFLEKAKAKRFSAIR